MADHGIEFEALRQVIQTMVGAYNTEMRKDIIREKAIRISPDLQEVKDNLVSIAEHTRSTLASITSDTKKVKALLATSADPKTQTWGSVTLQTLDATGTYLKEYLNACEQAIEATPDMDLSDLFERCDNMRDAFELQYEAFVQVTGIK